MTQTSTLPKEHTLLSPWQVSDLTPPEFAELGAASAASSAGKSHEKLSLAQLRYLAQFGLLAPTSHNTIPQRLRLDEAEGAIDVFVERASILRHSDEKGRQALVSLGCVIANLELAAEALGWQASVRITGTDAKDYEPPDGGGAAGALPVARIEFSNAGTGSGTPWLELMRDRKVLRAEYDRTVGLPAELIANLQAAVEQEGSGVSLERS